MKRIIRTITILAFAVVSCQKVDNEADLDPVNPSGPKRVNLVITAQAGGEGGTRTQLLDDDRVHWLPSEEINVFSAGEMAQFHSTNTERTGYARFVGSISVMTEPQEGEDADVWALYPYYADATLAAGVLTTTLPSTQFGVDGTFADDLVIAAARKVNPFIDLDREGSMGVNAAGSNLPTLALDMNFWNVCSGMWFTVDRSDITSVTMTATGGEPIAGTFSFDFDADGFPRVRSVSAPSSSITLTAPDGGAFTPGVKYYFVTLPVTFSQGVTFDFVTDTMVGTRTIRSAFSLERSIFSWKEHLDAPVSFIPDSDATHAGDFDFETHSVEYHEEFRAMWVATVKRIDFPAAAQGDAVAQRAELVDLFQDIKRMGFNAIVFQVNPMADAFWNSELLPWSMYLTGTQGEDPGYNPLQLAVETAHSLGLELHAWFNPLRIGPVGDVRSETHPMFSHPDWYQTYSGSYYWNPDIPEVRTFLGEIMRDVVTNYDVDGTHIDDYFYPSGLQSNKRTWDDSEQFAEYGGNYSLYNWRVHNIDLMVQNYQAVTHAAKAHVVFGAAPVRRADTTSSSPAAVPSGPLTTT